MKSSRRSAALVLLVLFAANPAYAGLESCRDPTPDERFQLDLCSAHAGCRLVVALMDGCTSVTNGIRRFFSSQRPELDPGEYQSDRNAPPGPSEIEQARKDNELYQRNQSLRESAARDAYNGLVVSDRSIKARLERYCGNPLDQGCKDAVQDAESLANRLSAYNNNPDHVALRGRLTAESPGIAAPYGKLQAAAWEETNRKSEELNKSIRERQAAEQKLLEAEKKKKEGNQVDPPVDGTAAKSPGGVDAITDMLQKGASQVGDWFSKAFSSEQKPSMSEEEQKTAREASAWVDQNLAATQVRADREQEEKNRKAREASESLDRAREAERLANQTPAERITEGFDQRIATARQQCAANDSSCNSGCMAVAAVGVLSIFMARGSASSAAGEQVQQCSNRCEQAKSSCEQEVSALEQEKAQAIAAATAPRMTPGSSMAGAATQAANRGGGVCSPDDGLLQRYVDAQTNWTRVATQFRPTTLGAARQRFLQIHDQHFKNHSPEVLQQKLNERKRSLSTFRHTGPQSPMIAAEEQVMIQMLECEVAQSRTAGMSAGQRSNAGAGCAGSPQESFKRFDNEMAAFARRFPNQRNRGGARDQYQYMIFYGGNGLQTLERYRTCLSAADYQANKNALENARNSAQRGCEQLSSSQGTCVAAYPSNWN